jgi:hypothetical protein
VRETNALLQKNPLKFTKEDFGVGRLLSSSSFVVLVAVAATC